MQKIYCEDNCDVQILIMTIMLVKNVLSIFKELFINYLRHFVEHSHNLHVFVGPLCGETQGTCKMYSLFLGLLHSRLFLCKTVATRIVAATQSNTTGCFVLSFAQSMVTQNNQMVVL